MTQTPTGPSDYARLKALFLELHEADADSRAARLAELDASQPGQALALRRLLHAEAAPLPSLDQADSVAAPVEFPRYRLLRELGRGGMGRVWLAERSDGAFAQRYALKQLDRERWSAGERERFVRERQILAELDHRHIATLVDGGSDSRGAPFLVTGYIDGQRIDDYADSQGLNPRQRAALVRDLADAVAYAHSKLVVHRDIKPANVLVGRDGVARLLDFGIAKLLDDSGNTTAEGASLMTLRYAAPEQVRGERVGVGCDIYALGVMLYELLAGASPYAAAEGPAALTQAILQQEPPPPSQRARATGRAAVDADLDAICARCLRKRAEDRYASAGALRDDLQRYLEHEPVQARRGERGYRLRRWLRRRWVALLAVATLLALGGYHLYRLDAQLAQTQAERDRARAVGRLFADMFATLPPAEVRDGEISARRLLELTSRNLLDPARSGGRDERLNGVLLAAVADAQEALGLNSAAEPLYAEAARRLREAGPEWSLDAADVESRWGGVLYDLRRGEEGLAILDQGRERLRRQGLRDSTAYFDLGNSSGLILLQLGRLDEARERYEEALATPLTPAADGVDVRPAALTNLAAVELFSGNGERAEALLRRADAIAQREASLRPARALKIRLNLAWVLRDLGKRAESRSLFDDVTARGRQFWGSGHGDFAIVLSQFSSLDLLDNRPAEALVKLDEGIATETALGGPDHARTKALRSLRLLALVAGHDNVAARDEAQRLSAGQPLRGIAAVAMATLECRSAPSPIALETLRTSRETSSATRSQRWAMPLTQRWLDECAALEAAKGVAR